MEGGTEGDGGFALLGVDVVEAQLEVLAIEHGGRAVVDDGQVLLVAGHGDHGSGQGHHGALDRALRIDAQVLLARRRRSPVGSDRYRLKLCVSSTITRHTTHDTCHAHAHAHAAFGTVMSSPDGMLTTQ